MRADHQPAAQRHPAACCQALRLSLDELQDLPAEQLATLARRRLDGRPAETAAVPPGVSMEALLQRLLDGAFPPAQQFRRVSHIERLRVIKDRLDMLLDTEHLDLIEALVQALYLRTRRLPANARPVSVPS